MKEKEIKYKQLFLTFAWQFCLVILTLNIGASILLAIESKAETNPPSKEDLLKNFSLQFNITVQDLEQLFSELDTFEVLDHNTMTYLEAVMLVVSLFFTIGKSQVQSETESV